MRTWQVWRTFYGTYAEIEAAGDRKAIQVARSLTWEEATALVERLGFGHNIVPEDVGRMRGGH